MRQSPRNYSAVLGFTAFRQPVQIYFLSLLSPSAKIDASIFEADKQVWLLGVTNN